MTALYDHTVWVCKGVQQGPRKRRMYRGYGPTYFGSVSRMHDGRIEMEKCCANGHATMKAAREHGVRVARAKQREAS